MELWRRPIFIDEGSNIASEKSATEVSATAGIVNFNVQSNATQIIITDTLNDATQNKRYLAFETAMIVINPFFVIAHPSRNGFSQKVLIQFITVRKRSLCWTCSHKSPFYALWTMALL